MRGLCLLLMLMGAAVPACAAALDGPVLVSGMDQPWREAGIKILGGKGHGSGGGTPHTHYLLLNTGGNNNNRILLNGGGLLLCNAC